MTFLSKKSTFAYSALAVSMMIAQAHAAAIQSLSASQISDNTTQISIGFDGTPVSPVAYQQAGSNQLMLDFNQTSNNGLPRTMPIHRGVVDSIMAVNNGDLTRLVVSLNKAANYTSAIEGNQLVIKVVEGGVSSPVNQPTTSVKSQPVEPMMVKVNPLLAPTATSLSSSYEGISAINYAKAGQGGNITIALANEAIPVDVQRQGNKLVIRTTGATVPRHLLRQLQAGGLVANISATNQGQSGMVTVTMTGDYEYQAYQAGSSLNISIMPPKAIKQPGIEDKVYTGEPLSMEFQDVSVRTVLGVLGQFTETNIVASDSVTGNITLRLMNVPWDQALDIILKSKNLDMRKNGNVILVAPAKELNDQEEALLDAERKKQDLLPLRTEYIRLNYAKADDVLKLLDDADSPGSGGDQQGKTSLLASSRGVITSDARTNTIIIKDTSEGISAVRAVIEKIDIPVKQVMIEARIVTATESFSKEIGVQWGTERNSSKKPLSADSTGLAINLGSATGRGAISIGLLSIDDLLLDLSLAAMQAERRGEVISAPKVLTADKQTAKISSGKQIPYQEATASGATATSFKEAALSLEATPNITPDGKISIKLDVRNSDTTGEIYAGVPVIREDALTTNVVLEDGQTVVLGGAFRNTIANGENKVPFLGDLPGLGRLFKHDNVSNNKEELLIFITPKLVNDGISRIE